jgi:hypothetical protein
MLNFLRTVKLNIDKRRGALAEEFDLFTALNQSASKLQVLNNPFPHIIIDNFFRQPVYEGLRDHFTRVLQRGLSETNDPTRFHAFVDLRGEFQYDGYLYVPRFGEEKNLQIFFSLAWNLIFSKLFDQPTSYCTTLAYHHHPTGNKTGFVHHDYSTKWFSHDDALPNGVIFRSHDKERLRGEEPRAFPQVRTIALIYYLDDATWHSGDGGETGLYQSKVQSPIKLVAPLNNRLLAFQISPKSFHAFQENFKPRSSIVQWFHFNHNWCLRRYGVMPK